MVRQIQPLFIGKKTPSSTPNKMPTATSRPLQEIGSTERRRNSPSYNQATRKMIVSRESSPYTENSSPPSFLAATKASPWSARDSAMSPARFDSENTPEPSPSPSPQRRSSIERLKQASRVRNSNIFALETKDAYDPTTLPVVERPTANRPLSNSFITNSFTRMDSMRKENNPFRSPKASAHKRTESQTQVPILSPSMTAASIPLPASPEKRNSPSPTKSSLARTSQFGLPQFDESGVWSDDERLPTPRALHRHAKSVTFHAEPPLINEYEQQTPEPSVSNASDREGSWDSDDFYDEDISFERGSSAEPQRDESFDADLENADKTPVVLPEDWSRMSPEEARTDLVDNEDDVFDPDSTTLHHQSERVASNGSDVRPLPPLPAFATRERRDSNGLSEAAERAAHATRNLPLPPKRASCSKEDILNMTSRSTLSLEDRLQLMSGGKEERPSSKSSKSSQDTEVAHQEEITITNLDTSEKQAVQVTETELPEDSVLADFAPPRISRESILRKVRGSKYDYDDEEDYAVDGSEYQPGDDGRPSIAELARLGPDQPAPSRETSRETSDTHDVTAHGLATYERWQETQQREVVIKEEPVDDDYTFNMNDIPAAALAFNTLQSPAREDDYDRQGSVLRHDVPRSSSKGADDDTESRYSSLEPDAESTVLQTTEEATVETDGKETLNEAMQLLTVKDYSEPEKVQSSAKQGGAGTFIGLPTYDSADNDYDFGIKEWITPSPPAAAEDTTTSKQLSITTNMPTLQPPSDLLSLPSQSRDRDVSPPDTPTSVIDNEPADAPVSPIDGPDGFAQDEEEERRVSDPGVPERIASIKTGGKLKTRKSASRADFEQMAEQRRMVSGEMKFNPVPAIPEQFRDLADDNALDDRPESSTSASDSSSTAASVEERDRQKQRERRKSRKSGGRMDLDLGLDTSAFSIGDSDSLGLDKEFERVIEAQKVCFPSTYSGYLQPGGSVAGTNGSFRTQKGYLMRQNTKLVVATNRNFSGESDGTAKSSDTVVPGKENGAHENDGPMSPTADGFPRPTSAKGSKSPRKPSAEQFIKTEPWNGKARRKSVRNASALKDAPFMCEAAPPLPGQESAALGVVDEDYAAGSANLEEDVGEGVERGRLFVKVMGVKELDMPMPRGERTHFQLTLDNGLHCVTTSSLELGNSAPIGQEFELVVLNDLEFQLTLTTKLPAPPKESPVRAPPSPSKSNRGSKSGSAFTRFLSSPKKRAEKERQEREAAEAEERRAQEEAARKSLSRTPTAYDLLHKLVDRSTGSFARAYVNLAAHEQYCFGRPVTVDIPCYNEWALEEDQQVVNSVRSKRGTNAGPVRRPPYVIGLLELQLLYVPKPKGAGDEDMPKSMSSAVREMTKARAEDVDVVTFEGVLSQQGGDCQHWRRRFFRLTGPKLTAYHEHTHQKRAVINLSKASRLVDDKSTLVANPSPSKSGKGGRRKSAFAEEDEGYAYVEEGFRIRFANGETIDFYADSRAKKDEWMEVLAKVVGKADVGKGKMGWTDLVLARERAAAKLNAAAAPSTAGAQEEENVSDIVASPVKNGGQRGVDVVDFEQGAPRPSSSQAQFQPPVPRTNSYVRKPVGGSKSVPNSPVKGKRSGIAPPPAGPSIARPRTPPMQPRTGHRSRNAVKSMIF